MDKLLEYQKTHVESIINSLVVYNRALDASDTGTGISLNDTHGNFPRVSIISSTWSLRAS